VFRSTREKLDGYVPVMKELIRDTEFRLPRGRAATHAQEV
jgi:hypothetical protein